MKLRTVLAACLFIFASVSMMPALHAGWALDGAPVCINMGTQDKPKVLSDGAGGAFVVWNDARTWTDIYAQRLDHMGRPQWAENGIVVCHGDNFQDYVEIAPDGAGGFIAVWQDSRQETHFDIYAQRMAPDGSMLWTADGVPVSAAVDDQVRPKICTDGAGGCIIAWVDERTDPHADDIYAQRLSAADGSALWTTDGVAVCTADSTQSEARIVSDGAGGAVIVWIDNRTEQDIYAQRLGPDGAALWPAGGAPVCDLQTVPQYEHEIATDGFGGAFVTWCDRQGGGLDIYAQRIDDSGNVLFGQGGFALCGASGTQREPAIAFDGDRGAIVAWEDFRKGPEDSDVYVQRISGMGGTLYSEPDGILVCDSANNVYWVEVFCNVTGEAVIAWEDLRDSGTSAHDIYAQRIDGDGIYAWTRNGEPLCTATDSQTGIDLTGDGAGGVIAAWTDYRNPDWDIYAMRITCDGGYVGTELSSFGSSATSEGIALEWSVSEARAPADFRVSRRSAESGEYGGLAVSPETSDGLSFSVMDRSADRGVEYTYRVDIVENGSRSNLFETGAVSMAPAALRLMQNSPNPFNPSTRIAYSLDAGCHVRLEVFDAAGRSVAVLVDGLRGAGGHEAVWNGTGNDGRRAASGVYMYRLTAGKRTLTRKMVLLR